MKKRISDIVPSKTVLWVQNVVCVVMIAVMLAVSFLPIFTLEYSGNEDVKETTENVYNDLAKKLGVENKEFTFPDKIEVSFPFLIKSGIASIDVAKLVIEITREAVDEAKEQAEKLEQIQDQYNNVQNGYYDDLDSLTTTEAETEKERLSAAEKQELVDKAFDQDTMNLMVLIMATTQAFGDNFLIGVGYTLLIMMVFILPIVCLVSTIKALIALLKNLRKPEKSHPAISRSFISILSNIGILLFVIMLVKDVKFGGAVTAILVCIGVGIVANLVASRLKSYNGEEFKYLNVVQIVSAVTTGSFILYFLNIMKSGFAFSIVDRLKDYFGEGFIGWIKQLVDGDKPDIDIVAIVCVYLFFLGAMYICNYLPRSIARLACMVPEKKGEHIVGTIIFGLFLIASPLYLMSDSSNFKFAPSDDAKSAFWVAVAGIVLMVAGEITLFALRKTLCGKLDEEGRKAVMGGYVMHTVGELDGDAPAEEAPVEEAPAEETTEKQEV